MTRVKLRCPCCSYTWHAATIDPRYDEVSLKAIANQVNCPRCDQRPPMDLEVPQLPLPMRSA